MALHAGVLCIGILANAINFCYIGRFAARYPDWRSNIEGEAMKVRASVRRICENCKIVRRKGVVRVICTTTKHKQKQG